MAVAAEVVVKGLDGGARDGRVVGLLGEQASHVQPSGVGGAA
ncbi:hypothetical protein ACIBG8_42850 [Nonomuraea sp. NPDC050556]